MSFSAVLTKSSTTFLSSQFKAAPNTRLHLRLAKQYAAQSIDIISQQLPRSGSRSTKEKSISRREYPRIVELKIAGRSDRAIAERLSVPVNQVKLHAPVAMREYKKGQLRINGGNAVYEAGEVGKEQRAEFQEDLGLGAQGLGQEASLSVIV